MQENLWINKACALFLDFDGTLVDIAAQPDAVIVPPGLPALLASLSSELDGALAIVTGRPIGDIDRLLAPLRVPIAGEHGAERRTGDGALYRVPEIALDPIKQCMASLLARFPRLILETKRSALALHYRQMPEAAPICLAALEEALHDCPDAVLLNGKMVFEVKPAGVNKGSAIHAFLLEAPFAGRRPVFAGDDVTDETAITYVEVNGGVGIKIGAGVSAAQVRLADPSALRSVLESAARNLRKAP